MKKNYDVIVVGGGMVGSAFALLLAKQTDLKIALVEATCLKPLQSMMHLYNASVP